MDTIKIPEKITIEKALEFVTVNITVFLDRRESRRAREHASPSN